MSELPPEAAALLARARNAHGPQQADRDRVLHGLHATLGISAAAAIAATTATTASATAAAVAEGGSIAPAAGGMLGWKSALLTWKAGKVMLATVAIGGAVGVGSATLPRREPVHEQRSAELTKASRREAARPSGAARSEEGAPPTAEPTVEMAATPRAVAALHATAAAQPATGAAVVEGERTAVDAAEERPLEQAVGSSNVARAVRDEEARAQANDAPSAALAAAVAPRTTRASEERSERRRARRERRTHKSRGLAAETRDSASSTNAVPVASSESPSATAAAPSDDAARGEVTLLRSALASVRDGNGQQALTLLAEHAARYPSGAFSTERRGLRVLALCAAGKSAEGLREQAAFLRDAGGSPIAARVRSACSDREP